MTVRYENRQLFMDLTEALGVAFPMVCVAVIVDGEESPDHVVGDPDAAELLVALESVQATLADGIPRTEAPSSGTVLGEADFVAVESVSIPYRKAPETVIAFAGKHLDDRDRAVALLHSLAAEIADELMLLKVVPFLATALGEVECGVTIADPSLEDTPLIYANAAFERMTGYSKSEMLGHNCRFLQGDLTDQSGVRVLRNALARGTDCTTVLTNFRRNGESFENRIKLRMLRTNDGQLSYIIGIQLDVTREHQALELLGVQKRRHESMIEAQSGQVWLMDAEGGLVETPAEWLELAGLSSSGGPPDLAAIRGALEPEAAEAFRDGWVKALREETPFEVVYRLPAGSRSSRWFLDRVTPVFDDDDKLFEWVAASQEITGLKRVESELQDIIDTAPVGMIVVDGEGRITFANTQAEVLFGYERAEMTDMSVDALVPLSVRSGHADMRAAFLEDPEMRRMSPNRDVEGVRKDGSRFFLEAGLSSYGEGDDVRVVAAFTDITELKHAREEIERAAYQDRLTGALSSEGFTERLGDLLEAKDLRPASPLVVLDVKALREINNTQGSEAGDEVLQEVARRLMAEVGEGGLVARIGGDEFALLVTREDQMSPRALRKSMAAVFDVPFEVDGFPLRIEASFGYVRVGAGSGDARVLLDSAGSNDARVLLGCAALAMHESQQDPARTWTRYSKSLELETRATVDLTKKLRHALEAGELELYYQPQVDIDSGRVISAEALLRWNHPEDGFISPGRFIPLAEKSQLIEPIGDWVLHRACRDIKAWQDAGGEVPPVSINISLIQFQMGSVPNKVRQALIDHGLAPERLTLEITESIFEADDAFLANNLNALREMGVRLSMDDFGTGYSSLAHLYEYAFDEIKIDQKFVYEMDQNPYARSIVKMIVIIAGEVGASVVAEGIERADDIGALRDLGCSKGQGFYYSHAVPEPEWRRLFGKVLGNPQSGTSERH